MRVCVSVCVCACLCVCMYVCARARVCVSKCTIIIIKYECKFYVGKLNRIDDKLMLNTAFKVKKNLLNKQV